MKRLFAAAFVAFGALGASVTATSAATYNYDFSYRSPNGTGFTDIVLYAEGEGQNDMYFVPGSLAPSGYASLTHTVSFEANLAMALGVSARVVPEGEAPAWDILMLMSEDFLAANSGQLWSEIFPRDSYPRHSVITAAIMGAHSGIEGDIATLLSFFASSQAHAAMFDPSGSFVAVQFTPVAPLPTIPLPAGAWLLMSALGGLGFAGWRRKRAVAA